MNSRPTVRRSLPFVLGLVAAITLSACAAGGASSTPVGDGTTPTPGASQGGGGSSGGPGGGDTGTGVSPSDPGSGDQGQGQAMIVLPKPGQLKPHPVGMTLLEAAVDGRRVTVKVSWYSGVEPCYVLDSVRVDEGANEFVLTVIEGTSDPNAACIEIAMYKATIVDLGELEPGEYTIRASQGEAPPITVTVG
jgi:hypothetical protein